MKGVRGFLCCAASIALTACVAAGCSGAKNDEQAYYTPQGPGYVIELRGRRYFLAHDPLSALRRKTYEATYQLVVPRIEGTIDGSEIPRRPGYLRYSGTIEIAGGRMTIKLAYRNDDDTRLDPFTWNGTYRLRPK